MYNVINEWSLVTYNNSIPSHVVYWLSYSYNYCDVCKMKKKLETCFNNNYLKEIKITL